MDLEANSLKLEALELATELMSPGDQKFAKGLLSSFERYQALTEKQWYWVDQLVDRVLKTDKRPPQEQLDKNFLRVFRMFSAASEHLKFPKIHLRAGDYLVCLSLAGPRSKHFGKIQLTDGEPYYRNEWYGTIDSKGVWVKPVKKEVPVEIQMLIEEFAENPEKVAAEYGALTGNCCFCHRNLSDDRSVDAGYGPICAKRFGLRWG